MNVIEAFKEETNKFLKEIYETTNKLWKVMNQTTQAFKVEIESIKET